MKIVNITVNTASIIVIILGTLHSFVLGAVNEYQADLRIQERAFEMFVANAPLAVLAETKVSEL